MKNQYFQMVFSEEKAYIHFYPAEDGGKNLNISEVEEYLRSKQFDGYDLKELHAAMNSGCEEQVYVGPWDGIKVRETMDIRVSLDKMRVVCQFYPPSEGGGYLDETEIINDLGFHKVRFGIKEDAVKNYIQNRKFCTDIVVAEGLQPVHGRDARIEYMFPTDRKIEPLHNEDGTVNYKELNTISHVQKGGLLARLIPADPGKTGRNVYGEEIKPRTVKSCRLEYGRNISINEDKTEIYSDVTGHAMYINGKVFVSDVYEVPADVDNSIGNINYDGSVHVKGNIKSGFTVEAEGDVIVDGVIENASVYAGGQIIVKRGVQGMHKGVLKAGSNVISKYIENATVSAGGYIESEIILNSTVSSGGTIKVHGRKGLINGGVTRAANCIEANNFGTEMETPTILEVGVDPAKKERYTELKKQIAQADDKLTDQKVILDNYAGMINRGERLPADKLRYVQQLALAYKEEKARLEPLREEMNQIHVEMMMAAHSYVSVTGKAYPGVTISIADMEYHVKSPVFNSKFKKQDGNIKTVPL